MDTEIAYLRGFCDGLEGTIKQLRALHDSSQRRAEGIELRSRAVKNGQGLAKLPNELISYILEYAICLSQTNASSADGADPEAATLEKDVLAVSHVNRQFLYVARSTPRLWTTITQLYPCSLVETFLERSGMCGIQVIQVDTRSRHNQQDIRPFSQALQALCRNAHRLEALVIRTEVTKQQELIHEVLLGGTKPHFPRLQRLDVVCPYIKEYERVYAAGPPSYETLLGIRFPSLRILGVPDYMLYVCTFKTLTSVHLSPGKQPLFDVSGLLHALAELPGLGSFSLVSNYEFHFAVAYYGDLDSSPGPVELPTVKDLELRASTETSAYIVEDILQHISLPNLEIMTLDLSIESPEEVQEMQGLIAAVDALGSHHHSFPELHTLHLSRYIRSDVDTCESYEFDGDPEILSRMPGLRNISLSHTIPDDTVRLLGMSHTPGHASDCMLPLLESISLQDCDDLGGEEILNAIRSRQNSPTITPVKKLVIKNCGEISQEDHDDLAEAMEGYGSLEVEYYNTIS